MSSDTSPLDDIITDFENEHGVIATTARGEIRRLQAIEEVARAYVYSRAPGNSVTKFPKFQALKAALEQTS